MDSKNFLVAGGSSGIGLEITKTLREKDKNVYVASRSNDALAQLDGLHHLAIDVQAGPLNFEGLPDVLNGIVYCPGTIRLKPFHRLTMDDFFRGLAKQFLGGG